MAVGETPNLAARLQSLARPNTVVASELTKRLAGSSFSWEDLGELALKGIAEAVHGWTVAGVRSDNGEHEPIAPRTMPLLVGRDEEIGLLRRAWQQSKEGHGQVVLISGEPGIGKSALVGLLGAQLRAGVAWSNAVGIDCLRPRPGFVKPHRSGPRAAQPNVPVCLRTASAAPPRNQSEVRYDSAGAAMRAAANSMNSRGASGWAKK
jgi:hypothetical protein